TVANENSTAVSTKPYALLFLGCVLVTPSVLSLIKSLWKITFKDSKTPRMPTVIFTEFFVALGTAVLTIVAMPKFDILTNVMMLNSVAILSAVLQVAGNIVMKERIRFITTSIFAVIFITLGYSLFVAGYCVEAAKYGSIPITPIGLAIAGTLCVSLNWWENYSMLFKSHFLQSVSEDIKRSRNIVCIVSSFVRIGVIASVLGAYVILSGQQWSSILSVSQQTKTVVLSLFAVQVISTSLCHWFALVACKMHAVRRSFVIPMWMVSPAVLVGFLITFISHFQSFVSSSPTAGRSVAAYCETMVKTSTSQLDAYSQLIMDARRTLCSRSSFMEGNILVQGLLGSSLLCWWIGLVLCTIYTCFLKVHRIERTRDLFVRRHYEAAFIDQSMLLNIRLFWYFVFSHSENEVVSIYLCATMWHETYDEMMKMIISMFRLDKFRPRKNFHNDVSFESHIYFDDAFQEVEGSKERHINEYAETLVVVIKEVYIIFKKMARIPNQEIIRTPYGGRLRYTLPHGNILNVHFKDKNLIRHKKRWSQVSLKKKHKLNIIYFEVLVLNPQCHILHQLDFTVHKTHFSLDHNTCILALDGDTDFQPSAVMLLLDRLRLYPEVGAVCGRIHPTGTGPMVWYQKFEYAVGHWLQKSAEHVFGSVLCSPGCFSLFRAAALMDDNVMKKYTTKATEAAHYVQYDQGEDRWLCTLLLQQGWRVEYNAASDSYTNAPQEFKEFYNQRRRWGPSTMANTLDLLGTGSLTSQRNKSISKPYMIYQTISMAASVLGPATVCLMIAGCFSFVFHLKPNDGLILAILPPAVYLVLCYKLKADTQITIAAIMSIFYAFLMTATILSIIGDMVTNGTFFTPSGLFFISIVLMYLVTAVLHPQEFHLVIYGLLYVLTIPSGYLLLAIYSLVNMNNVSWGTRETAKPNKVTPGNASTQVVKYAKSCKCCCWNVRIQVDQDEKVTVTPAGGFAFSETQPQEEKETIQYERDLQERYLKPLDEDKEQQKKIAAELKDLRNKATFVFFMCNALWLMATYFLQAIGGAVSIRIPKVNPQGHVEPNQYLYIDPIGLMFLLGFSSLLMIQFFAMLWHRIQTLIHYVAYNGTEVKVMRKAHKKSLEEAKEEMVMLMLFLRAKKQMINCKHY
uniref:chitin synthase n=1 Tax=Scleropages formosus TaxID=113540 RepID=A0A8C9S1A1_SCLFO